jgi:GTPase SAR1 family protein
MCFAIDHLHSLQSLRDNWAVELSAALGPDWTNIPKIVVGMKSDYRLDDAPGLVSIDDVTRVFPQLKKQEERFVNYIECSSKTQEGEAAVFAGAVAAAEVYMGEDKGGRNAERLQFFLILAGLIALVVIFVDWHVSL